MSSASIATVSQPAGVRRWGDSALLRALALAATLTGAAAYQAHRLVALTDQDIWWHLRTGLWILQNRAIPRTSLFSQAPHAWIDASWGFDLLVAIAYRGFGLAGIPVFLMLLQVATALALFLLARAACRSFWPAVILAAIAQCCIVPVQPRSGMCSLVFLAIELVLFLEARQTGNARVLYWLPPLFVLWVNFDRQFAYGLMVLALFCLAAVAEELGRRSGSAWLDVAAHALRLGALGVVAVVTLLATLLSPYLWHLYGLVWQSATSSAADRYFRELHSMRFRQPQDYLLMLLAMTAFFALGRRHSRDPFLFSLLIISSLISFCLMRDSWLVVVVSVGVVGSALYKRGTVKDLSMHSGESRLAKLGTAGMLILVAAAVAALLPGRDALISTISETLPVRASDYIQENHLPGPLFNTYPWGGFLTWYLPGYPVNIDGRRDLYGDHYNVEYFRLMNAELPLESDFSFAKAQTFLLEANSPMAQALSTLPNFKVAYRDHVAIVLVRMQ